MRQRPGFQLQRPKDFFGSTVSWIDATGKRHSRLAGPSLLHEPMGLNQPSRRPTSHPLRRNTEGFYWFSQLKQHVWYESMEEYTALMRLDHLRQITAIVTQPMRIDFTDGSAHFPDIFVEHIDGRQELCNVRPASLIDAKTEQQFANTESICSEIGWKHQVLPELSRIERHNLEWIAAYRHRRHAPTPLCRALTLAAAEPECTFGAVWDVCKRSGEEHAVAGLYHLMWKRELLFDANQPLQPSTSVRRAVA